jgi:SAM-dependent methyltransferase
MQQGELFALKVDYRGLPPPLEELDLVHLLPAPAAAVPPGSLVLRPWADGFQFVRLALGETAAAGWHARVVEVERPGVRIRLDSRRWRAAGRLSVRVPAFRGALEMSRRLQAFLRKVTHPLACSVRLAPPEFLVADVVRKYAHPGEVAHQVTLAHRGLEDWERDLFSRVFPPASRVLVVGCGVGREARALARAGHRVVGIDAVARCIDVARREAGREGLDAAFEVRAAQELDDELGTFDAILCSSAVYEQMPTRGWRIELLRRLGRHVTPGGVLVLCAGWNPTRGTRDALVDLLRRIARRLWGDGFLTEPGDRLIRHLSLASDANTACFYHVFASPDEIRREIVAAGWSGDTDPTGPWILRRAS